MRIFITGATFYVNMWGVIKIQLLPLRDDAVICRSRDSCYFRQSSHTSYTFWHVWQGELTSMVLLNSLEEC